MEISNLNVDMFHDLQREWSEENNPAGFCFSAGLATINKHDFALNPGRYVGAD